MKRLFLGILIVICLTSICAFSVAGYTPKYCTAEVATVDGVYVFTDSQPVMPYDSLGVVELGFVSGTQYESIRTNLLKRVKKAYPAADGVILNLDKKGIDNCKVIKFK